MSTERRVRNPVTIIDRDLHLWLYEQHMERKGTPLKERPFRPPKEGTPEYTDMQEAVDEWLDEYWPAED